MLSFFKKKIKDEDLKRDGEESVIEAKKLNLGSDVSTETLVNPELSIHPSWILPNEEIYVYRFLNNDCPPLKQNQISLAGIEWQEEPDNIRVSALIRNSTNKTVLFGRKTLVVLDAEGKPYASKEFDLKDIGEIPANSSRPWHFSFEEKFIIKGDWDKTGWRLAFDLNPALQKHRLIIPKEVEKRLVPANIDAVHKLFEDLRPLASNEVNLLGVFAEQNPLAGIDALVMFRNGSQENVQIDRLTLQLKDHSKRIVAKQAFELGDFVIKANTSKLWQVVFTNVKKQPVDLSSWEIEMK